MAEIRQQLIVNTAAVATGHPYGTSAGLEMLRDGGNAIDAAVAAMIALSVVIPGSVGLGGYGGSAVIYCCGRSPDRAARATAGLSLAIGDLRSGTVRGQETRAHPMTAQPGKKVGVFAVDFDSRAPLNFREGLVTADPESCYYGPRSVTVPAVVAGLEQILLEFGTKSWREVSQPAIRLADDGFEFDAEHKRHADRCLPKFDRQSLTNLFPAGQVPQIGERWRQPDLAQLLRRLADDGPASFYHGEIASQIIRFLRDRGECLLSEEDFRFCRPQIVEPVRIPWRGFDLYTPPPPSGGITSLGIIQTMDQCNMQEVEPESGSFFHLFAEASKACWQDRHQFLGDPDFISVPTEQLLSETAATARAEQIRKRPIPHSPFPTPHSDSSHTANVLATDADGNLISLTATQGWMYGSHLVVDGTGLVLNHGMSRFDYSQGHPNAPAPGKRMQHNMAPMIALRDGQAAFAYGLPGGPKIVSVTAQLALRTIAFGATPAAAIAAPRLHTDGNEPLLMSQHVPANVVDELEKLGHSVRREDDMGGPVSVLAIDAQGKIDVASGEATGAVAGF